MRRRRQDCRSGVAPPRQREGSEHRRTRERVRQRAAGMALHRRRRRRGRCAHDAPARAQRLALQCGQRAALHARAGPRDERAVAQRRRVRRRHRRGGDAWQRHRLGLSLHKPGLGRDGDQRPAWRGADLRGRPPAPRRHGRRGVAARHVGVRPARVAALAAADRALRRRQGARLHDEVVAAPVPGHSGVRVPPLPNHPPSQWCDPLPRAAATATSAW